MAVCRRLRHELAFAPRAVFVIHGEIIPAMWPYMSRFLLSLQTTAVDMYSSDHNGSLLNALAHAIDKGWTGLHLLDYDGKAEGVSDAQLETLAELLVKHCPSLRHLRLTGLHTNMINMSAVCGSYFIVLGRDLTSLDLSLNAICLSGAAFTTESPTRSPIRCGGVCLEKTVF